MSVMGAFGLRPLPFSRAYGDFCAGCCPCGQPDAGHGAAALCCWLPLWGGSVANVRWSVVNRYENFLVGGGALAGGAF